MSANIAVSVLGLIIVSIILDSLFLQTTGFSIKFSESIPKCLLKLYIYIDIFKSQNLPNRINGIIKMLKKNFKNAFSLATEKKCLYTIILIRYAGA